MKRKPIQLAKVTNPTGRIDVAAYRVAERVLEQLERERGIAGLRDHFLPVIEGAIVDSLPARNLINEIPEEVQAIFHVWLENRRRL